MNLTAIKAHALKRHEHNAKLAILGELSNMYTVSNEEIVKHVSSFDLSKQTWVEGKSAKNVPYREADIAEFMLVLLPAIDIDEDIFKVTIRRYPQNYFIAYEYEARDFYGGEDYTHEGDGVGTVPLAGSVNRVFKVAHAEFERNFAYYLFHLTNRINESIAAGYS